MAFRPGGLDPAKIDAAFRTFAMCDSSEALERAIDHDETLRSAMFHAVLRQSFLRLARERRTPDATARYHDFFRVLHVRAYRRIVHELSTREPPPRLDGVVVEPPSPYFTALC